MFPVEYLVAEMFWWQRIIEAKRSHPDNSWAGEHMTGSRAEGLNIPLSILQVDEREISFLASDLDIMIVKKPFEIKGEDEIPIFSVEYDQTDPRYVSLRLTKEYKRENESSRNHVFLNHVSFFSPTMYGQFLDFVYQMEESAMIPERIHGPARKVVWWINNCNFLPMDKAEVFEHPKPVMEWLHRERVWPSPEVVQQIRDCCCHLAPVGRGERAPEKVIWEDDFADLMAEILKENQESEGKRTMDETEWRMSFSLAENILGQSLSPMQRHVMVLLKMIKKYYLSDHGVISSYHLKNILFWVCENKEIDFWTEDNSGACVLLMMDRLEESLKKRHLPHYIMPESNLLQYEDPDELDKAAEAVRELRENILQKTVNALRTLQVATFQSRHYFNDLNDFEPSLSKFQVSSCTQEEMSEMVCALYQQFIDKYKEVIVVELGRDYETSKQKMTSAVNSVLSLIDFSGEWIADTISEIIVDDCSLPSDDSSSSNFNIYNELTSLSDAAELQRVFEFWNEMQTAMVEILEPLKINVFEDLRSNILEERDNLKGDTNANAAEQFATYFFMIPLIEKVKLMFSSHIKDMVDNNVRNLIDLYFSTISSLRLFVHKSILARIYCKLWFAKFDRDQSKDREAFTRFVCKDIGSCPLDEDFMALSLTFFDKMIEGKDACQIIPETFIMEKVKKIQETKADETVRLSKKIRSFLRNKLVEITEEIAVSLVNQMDDNPDCNIM